MKESYKQYQHIRYIDQPDLPLVIEIHRKAWTEEFRKYSTRDLISGGKVYENPEIIESSEYSRNVLKNGFYQVYPKDPEYFTDPRRTLSDYVYLYDNEEGLIEIITHNKFEDIRPSGR